MKKLIVMALSVGALCGCGNGEPKEFTGTIVDATMNTVTVKEFFSGKEITFTTVDADTSEGYGLLLGNLANVYYKGDLKATTPALKVWTDPTYARAVGRWTEPNPIAPDSVQGVVLDAEGAASIGMETLRYTDWEVIDTDSIRLRGQSIGNGETIDCTWTAVLRDTDGRLTLEIEDGPTYTKQE